MLELYINGSRVDLEGDETIAIDYAMFSVEDISKRKGARSYTFRLPATGNNRRILEVTEQVTNLTRLPYRRLDARLFSNGVDLLIRFATLVKAGNNYELNLYGIDPDFYALLKSRDITEIDLKSQNHYWTFANVVAGLTKTYENGDYYCYPIIDYGDDESVMGNIAREANPRFLLPAIFLDTVLNKIVSEAGYTLINDMEGDTRYTSNRLLFPCINSYISTKYNAVFEIGADTPCSSIVTGSGLNFGFSNINIMSITSIVSYEGSFYNLPYPVTITYGGGLTATGNGLHFEDNLSFRVRFSLEIENTSSQTKTMLIFWSAGTGATTSGFINVTVNAGTANYTFDSNVFPVNAIFNNQNNWVFFPAINQADAGFITVKGGSTIEIFEADENGLLEYGNNIWLSSLLPKISQADFLSNYMQLFNLIPITNEVEKTFTLKRFSYIADRQRALDWSDKLDLTTLPAVEFLANGYGQTNTLTWEKDGDELQPVGTIGEIIIDNENLELTKELIKLDFASTYTRDRLVDIRVCNIGLYKEQQLNKTKKPRLVLHKIVEFADLPDTTDLTLTDGVGTTTVSEAPIPYFIDTVNEYNIGFGNMLVPVYYADLIDVVQDYKKVTAFIRLNESDINQLDLTKPVYIKYFNAYFYVNKITGYKPASFESTKVELVKLF